MSDWYRGGRDADRGRFGAENRDRRESGGQDRWRRQDQKSGEQRSFEERHPDPARGGFTGMSYGEADFVPQDRGGWDFRGENYAGRREQDRNYGREDRNAQSYRSQPYDDRYGREGRGQQDWGHSEYARPGEPGYGGRQAYGPQASGGQRYGDERYRQGGGGMVGVNEPVQRVTDGETEHGLRANMGLGQHRGRGPKNYTRSDERIREDVNDRLSDDAWLDASEIEVQVTKCEVTLTGTVHTRDDKRRAEDLAEQVSGVRHVQNNLRIESHGAQGPQSAQGAQGTQSGTQGPQGTQQRFPPVT